jgi:hypothetical protein
VNHCGQIWRLEWGTESHLQVEDVHQEEWYNIPQVAVQNLCESIPRRTAAVLKSKGGPTQY